MAVKRSRIAGIAILGILGVLIIAWIDGGEEPLRTISEPVALPEALR